MSCLLLLIFLTSSFATPSRECVREALSHFSPTVPSRYQAYYQDTLDSMEVMRAPETGLIRDKILIVPGKKGGHTIQVLNANTSPTNIALDLLVQINADKEKVNQILNTLNKMPVHEETGLFFSTYSTGIDLTPISRDVSSVDNIHLSLALWTVQETFAGTPLARSAERLLRKMDYSAFYDEATGLFGGNLKSASGKWDLEAYRYSNFGSEARSIYSLVWALGLMKKKPTTGFVRRANERLTVEFFRWMDGEKVKPILRTWDGAAFQLFLPKLLLNEERYSALLAKSFENYGDFVLSKKEKIPSAHSASSFGLDGQQGFQKVPSYHGKSGSPELVSTAHVDIQDPSNRALWDAVTTPHALILAATVSPERFERAFSVLDKVRSGSNLLYRRGLGFMDGVHVRGIYQGQVVPVQLALDQAMIALAILQMKAVDGLSQSSRALMQNPQVYQRLREFYEAMNRKLESLAK